MSKGEKISAFQTEQIRAIAQQYDIGTCLQCAAEIKLYLQSQQIKGRHIRVDNQQRTVLVITSQRR